MKAQEGSEYDLQGRVTLPDESGSEFSAVFSDRGTEYYYINEVLVGQRSALFNGSECERVIPFDGGSIVLKYQFDREKYYARLYFEGQLLTNDFFELEPILRSQRSTLGAGLYWMFLMSPIRNLLWGGVVLGMLIVAVVWE